MRVGRGGGEEEVIVVCWDFGSGCMGIGCILVYYIVYWGILYFFKCVFYFIVLGKF